LGGLLMITCFPAAMPSIPPRRGPRRRTNDDYVDIGCSQRLDHIGERLSATLGPIFSALGSSLLDASGRPSDRSPGTFGWKIHPPPTAARSSSATPTTTPRRGDH